MTIETVEHLFAPNLPLRIKEARARAVEHPQLFLKGKATALVQILITYTNLDRLSTPIRFNRERPAKILGVSTRTIDRLLKTLETLGWLKRLPQPRLDVGSWGCTSISWASWVLDEVFTEAATTDKWGSKRRKAIARKPSPETDQKVAFEPSSEAPTSHAHRATQSAHLSSSPKGEVFQNKVVADASKKAQNQKPHGGRRIPADLVEPMTELGLTPANICHLMARCKAKGKRLQHVLSCTLEHMRTRANLRANQAVAWLLYMINLDRDYAHDARRAEAQDASDARERRRTSFLEKVAEKAFTRDRRLPGGLVVVDHMNGVVTMARGGVAGYQASPALPLARTLIGRDPWWVRRLLRGLDVSELIGGNAHAGDTASPHQPAPQSPSGPLDKASCREHLASLKALLTRRTATA